LITVGIGLTARLHARERHGLARQVFSHLTRRTSCCSCKSRRTKRCGASRSSALETRRTWSTGEAFVSYQDSVTDELLKQATDEAWVSINVTGKGPDIVLTETLAVRVRPS
jgi:hypothetical protein